jgi:hypothetical protein
LNWKKQWLFCVYLSESPFQLRAGYPYALTHARYCSNSSTPFQFLHIFYRFLFYLLLLLSTLIICWIYGLGFDLIRYRWKTTSNKSIASSTTWITSNLSLFVYMCVYLIVVSCLCFFFLFFFLLSCDDCIWLLLWSV